MGFKKGIILVCSMALLAAVGIFLVLHYMLPSTPAWVTFEEGQIMPLHAEDVVTDESSGLRYVKDQLIVSAALDADRASVVELLAGFDGEIVGNITDMNIFQVRINHEVTLDDLNEIAMGLEKSAWIEAVAFNGVSSIASSTEPYDPWEENYRKTDQIYDEMNPGGSNWGLEAIKAPTAWKHNDEMATVKIGVVDGGFIINNNELKISKSNADGVGGKKYLHTKKDYNEDVNWFWNVHGTYTTGIIGAIQDNRKGVAGVMKNREFFVYCVDGQDIVLQQGIEKCIRNGAKIINLSMGNGLSPERLALIQSGKISPETDLDVNRDRIAWRSFLGKLKANSNTSDFLIIEAAGNDGVDTRWNGNLCCINNEILQDCFLIVGGSARTSVGYERYENADGSSSIGENVDIVAPGEDIYGLYDVSAENIFTQLFSEDYQIQSGTSAAAPFVTGTAGMISGINPKLTCSEIRQIILDTGEFAYAYQGIRYNMVNAGAAVEKAVQMKNGTAAPDPGKQEAYAYTVNANTASDGREIYYNSAEGMRCMNMDGSNDRGVPMEAFSEFIGMDDQDIYYTAVDPNYVPVGEELEWQYCNAYRLMRFNRATQQSQQVAEHILQCCRASDGMIYYIDHNNHQSVKCYNISLVTFSDVAGVSPDMQQLYLAYSNGKAYLRHNAAGGVIQHPLDHGQVGEEQPYAMPAYTTGGITLQWDTASAQVMMDKGSGYQPLGVENGWDIAKVGSKLYVVSLTEIPDDANAAVLNEISIHEVNQDGNTVKVYQGSAQTSDGGEKGCEIVHDWLFFYWGEGDGGHVSELKIKDRFKIEDDVTLPVANTPASVAVQSMKWNNEYIDVDVSYPEISGMLDNELQNSINESVRVYFEQMAQDIEDVSKSNAAEFDTLIQLFIKAEFTVERNDGILLSIPIRIECDEGGANTAERSYFINIMNAQPGAQLTLQDLFVPGADAKAAVNEKIHALIANDEQMSADLDFSTIADDQGFYLTDHELVIVFPTYDIAAGIYGQPEFRIPLEEQTGLLRTDLFGR